jgi:hypothetical protein
LKQRLLTVQRFRFEARDLAEMPEPERVFAVFLGHIANEINILQRLIMMAHNLDDDPGDAETQGRTAQTMCLLRVLVGKLNEAHETIQRRYLKAGLESKLEGEFDEHVRASIQKFLTYFANPGNNTNVLRKKIAFHNDWEFVRQNVKSLPGDAALFLYSDGTVGNTLFHFADLG